MSGLVFTCSPDGRWFCLSKYSRGLNKTDITLVQKQYSRKRIRCGFNKPPCFLQLEAGGLSLKARATPGRREQCPQLGSHRRGKSLLRPAPALTLDGASAGRRKAALTRRAHQTKRKYFSCWHCHISQTCLSTATVLALDNHTHTHACAHSQGN